MFEMFLRFCLKGSICSMSSKGWGLSSADVGVFTNHQRIKEKFMRFERFLRFCLKGSICTMSSKSWGFRKAGAAFPYFLFPWGTEGAKKNPGCISQPGFFYFSGKGLNIFNPYTNLLNLINLKNLKNLS